MPQLQNLALPVSHFLLYSYDIIFYKHQSRMFGERRENLSELDETITSFIRDHNIREDVIFTKQNNSSLCFIGGNNFRDISIAKIYISPELMNVDKDITNYLIKKSLLGIKHSVTALSQIAWSVSSVAFIIIFSASLTTPVASGLSLYASVAAYIGYQNYARLQINKELMKECSDEELKGAYRFQLASSKFDSYLTRYSELFLQSVFYSGDSTLKTVQKELKERKITLPELEEDSDISRAIATDIKNYKYVSHRYHIQEVVRICLSYLLYDVLTEK